MQSISNDFDTASTAKIRTPQADVSIDWDLDGSFTDETSNLALLEIERNSNEPLGGVAMAQFDLVFNNIDNRFTPGSDSAIADYLKINKKGIFQLGFVDEYLDVGLGISETPEINQTGRYATIHFFDNMQILRDFSLTSGDDLYLDIKSGVYIWKILDIVFEDYFTVIGSFDADETWSNSSADTTNHRGGDQAITITSTDSGVTSAYTPSSAIDLSSYSDTDKFAMFLYVDDVDNIDTLTIRLHDNTGVDYYDLDVSGEVESGWNELWISRSSFSETGSPAWSSIEKVEIITVAITGQTFDLICDEMRMCSLNDYPRRYFDASLQEIGVAFFAGNTAYYEIKSACESEGARFYADESGRFHFENRQHYNVNPEYKVSTYGFSFSELLDYKHPKADVGTINSVKVRLEPYILQSEKTVWTYSAQPLIEAGETRTIWASLVNPCPTDSTGIVSPVATTDYTANDQADGGGTDRTASIGISITRFTDAVKIDVTNNYSSPVYLTSLKVRGTPAEKADTIFVKESDSTSVSTYGEIPTGGYEVSSKYLTDEDYANTLANQIITWYKDPLERMEIKIKGLPQLQIGDMITVINSETETYFIMRITSIKTSMSLEGGLIQVLKLRSVTEFETLVFFEINTSEIGGTDVISN